MVWVSYLPQKGRLRFLEFMCSLVAFDSSNFWCLVFWGLAVAAGYMLVCHDNPLFYWRGCFFFFHQALLLQASFVGLLCPATLLLCIEPCIYPFLFAVSFE
ncbi:hypothetical protein TorRG33x02_227730 [Trema orientale]|uniref:Transmembrane protein n=1 Tax=Trema orientale TaxID=63057 RepID=A0A2P5E7A0_TREOI|nr:hypothetical protein TorRG33x02_227730 [Trema orientale]